MEWQDVVNFMAGLWLVVSAFMQFGGNFNKWNYLLVGIIVAILSLWKLSSSRTV